MPRTPRDDDNPAASCLSETSRDVWNRWSIDRQRREIQRKSNAEQEAREAADLPLYPRECARRIAEDIGDVGPDWRHVRPTLGPAWGRLLKAQPELAPDLTKQREATITAVFQSVPSHMRESVRELRTLIDLLLTAHEAATFHVGYERGRIDERTTIDRDGHHDKRRTGKRRTKSAPRIDVGEMRLTLAEGER